MSWSQGINRGDAEKQFRNVKWVSAAASVVGAACAYDVGTYDGVRALQPATANLQLPCGIVDAVIAINDFGPVQVSGFNSNALVDGTTNVAAAAPLLMQNASNNLIGATLVTNAIGQFMACFVAGAAQATDGGTATAIFINCPTF